MKIDPSILGTCGALVLHLWYQIKNSMDNIYTTTLACALVHLPLNEQPQPTYYLVLGISE